MKLECIAKDVLVDVYFARSKDQEEYDNTSVKADVQYTIYLETREYGIKNISIVIDKCVLELDKIDDKVKTFDISDYETSLYKYRYNDRFGFHLREMTVWIEEKSLEATL